MSFDLLFIAFIIDGIWYLSESRIVTKVMEGPIEKIKSLENDFKKTAEKEYQLGWELDETIYRRQINVQEIARRINFPCLSWSVQTK